MYSKVSTSESGEISSTQKSQNDDSNSSSSTFRFSILVFLTVQLSSYVLLRRYSSATLHEQYDISSVLMVAEVFKFIISLFAIVLGIDRNQDLNEVELSLTAEEIQSPFEFKKSGFERVLFVLQQSGPMALQAMLYLVQNVLSFLALECLEGSTYSLLMQGKLFATAFFSLVIMRTTLNSRQWRSLLTLMLAVAQITEQTKPSKESQNLNTLFVTGLLYTFGNVTISGFSTVVMEKLFKNKSSAVNMWEQNCQLAFYSIIVYCGLIFYNSGIHFFHDWSFVAFLISFISGVGGIMVALALKYTDSILKQMASTFAIVLTTLFEWYFMEGPMNLMIFIGTVFVIVSVYNYNDK